MNDEEDIIKIAKAYQTYLDEFTPEENIIKDINSNIAKYNDLMNNQRFKEAKKIYNKIYQLTTNAWENDFKVAYKTGFEFLNTHQK